MHLLLLFSLFHFLNLTSEIWIYHLMLLMLFDSHRWRVPSYLFARSHNIGIASPDMHLLFIVFMLYMMRIFRFILKIYILLEDCCFLSLFCSERERYFWSLLLLLLLSLLSNSLGRRGLSTTAKRKTKAYGLTWLVNLTHFYKLYIYIILII